MSISQSHGLEPRKRFAQEGCSVSLKPTRGSECSGAFGLTVFLPLLETMDHQDDCGVKDSDSLFFECPEILGVFLHTGLDSQGRRSVCPEM